MYSHYDPKSQSEKAKYYLFKKYNLAKNLYQRVQALENFLESKRRNLNGKKRITDRNSRSGSYTIYASRKGRGEKIYFGLSQDAILTRDPENSISIVLSQETYSNTLKLLDRVIDILQERLPVLERALGGNSQEGPD